MIVFLPKCISENVEKCGQSAVTRSWNQKFPDPSGSSYHGSQLEWLISWLCKSVNYSAAKFYQLHACSANIFYLISLSSDLFVFAGPLFKLCIYSCMKPFVIKVLQLHVCWLHVLIKCFLMCQLDSYPLVSTLTKHFTMVGADICPLW